MQRFYFEHLEERDDTITLKNPELLHQLHKVLRVRVGEEFIFFNATDDTDYIFELKAIEKREAFFVKTGYIEKEETQKYFVHIIQALPNKLEKIELLLQKGVEVGVENFLFFRSERSQKLKLSDNKLQRLERIVIEAVEQSGRNHVPEIIFMDDLQLVDFTGEQCLFFHTASEESLALSELELDEAKNVYIFIGPEGGFSDEEIAAFEKYDFQKIYLGNTILRTETVGIVVPFFLNQC